MIIRDIPGQGMTGNNISRMPPSIVKAVCSIMASLDQAIKHDQKNHHGGYTYASAEAVYAALSKKMGQAGLICLSLEASSPEKDIMKVWDDKKNREKTVVFVTFYFQCILATEEDTYSDPRLSRSIRIQYTGPQAYQAAQSYVEKAILKSLFKLPTGDRDLDALPQADTLEDQVNINGTGEKPKRKSSYKAKKDKDEEKFNDLVAEIQGSTSADELQMIWTRECVDGNEWGNYPKRWADLLREEYDLQIKGTMSSQGALV